MAGVFVLDRATVLSRLGGDEKIYSMMVDLYLQEVENSCMTLAAALSSGEAPKLLREIHTIKGLLATFSDDEGSAVAFQAEQQVRLGQLQGLDKDVLVLQARLREVARVLEAAR